MKLDRAIRRVFFLSLAATMLTAAAPQERLRPTHDCFAPNSDPDLIIRYCTEAISAAPATPKLVGAYVRRGMAHRAKEQYAEAVADIDAALAIDPKPEIYVARGAVLAAARHPTEAIADLERAADQRPELGAALAAIAVEFADRQEFADAIPYFDAAVRRQRANAELLQRRGNAFDSIGQADRAIADFDAAIRLRPDFTAALVDRGIAYLNKEEHAHAMADFNAALRAQPGDWYALKNRALVLFDLDRYAEAANDLKAVVERRPDYPYGAIWLYLAEAHAGQNGRSALQAHFSRLGLERWPGPVAAMYLGRLSPDEVMAAARHPAPRIDRNQRCEALFYIGQFHLLNGRKQEAIAAFEATVGTGVIEFVEYRQAKVELKREGL